MAPHSAVPPRTARAPRCRPERTLHTALGVVAALCALTTGCTSVRATPPPAAHQVACRKPPTGNLPGSSGALTQDDSGVFCLGLGRRIDVFLTVRRARASSPGRWSEIISSDPRVLAPQNNGILTPPVGVTPGVFAGASAGIAQLTSRLPDGKTWQVTVEVR